MRKKKVLKRRPPKTLYAKSPSKKNFLSRLTSSSCWLFNDTIDEMSAFYCPDHATSLLLDDLKAKNAELASLFGEQAAKKKDAILLAQPVEEMRRLLKEEGYSVSRARLAKGYAQSSYSVSPAADSLISAYLFMVSGLKIEVRQPAEFFALQKLVSKGLAIAPADETKGLSSLSECLIVLGKDRLDIFSKMALFSFFYLHSGLFLGEQERLLYLFLSYLLIQNGNSYAAYHLARLYVKEAKTLQRLYAKTVKKQNHADLDTFVYGFAKILSKGYDEDILELRRLNYRS
jgi:hypothetical protein